MKLVNADAFIKEYSDNPANIILLGKRNGKAFDAGRTAERSVMLEALSKFQTIDPESLRPSAKWIVKQTAAGSKYTACSRCGIIFQYKTEAGELLNIDRLFSRRRTWLCGLRCADDGRERRMSGDARKTGFRMTGQDLFGRYARIAYGHAMSGKQDYHIYKCIQEFKSNCYCDTPLTYQTENNCYNHEDVTDVVNVIHCGIDESRAIRVALKDIELPPTISPDDVRSVVHCRDCRYAERRTPIGIKTEILCRLFSAGMKAHDYCSYGAKMKGVEDKL